MAKTPKRSEPKKAPETPAVSAPPADEKDSLIDTRLAIPLDKEGRVLVSNMRETSRDKLKSLLSNAALAKELGISPDVATAAESSLPAELMYPLVSGLSVLDMILVARLTNAPRELIERVVPYSLEETKKLAPKIAAVLDKHGASRFLSKYKEEAELGGWLIAMTVQKVTVIREEMEKLGPRGVVIPITPVPDRPADTTTAELEPQS